MFPYKSIKDASNIQKRLSEWIWDVEDFELRRGDDTIDVETQSDSENDEGKSGYFMNTLTNENN